MNTEYPIIIRINPKALEEFRASEEGSWWDYRSTNDALKSHAIFGDTHGYEILSRHAGKIEIRNANEAAEVYYRACSGTFQLKPENSGSDGPNYFPVACRIADQLREIAREVSVIIVDNWPSPSGY